MDFRSFCQICPAAKLLHMYGTQILLLVPEKSLRASKVLELATDALHNNGKGEVDQLQSRADLNSKMGTTDN